MESNSNNNSSRINRYRYFEVFISRVEGEELIPLLELEKALYDLEIKYRKSEIRLKNFHGQLEKDLLGIR